MTALWCAIGGICLGMASGWFVVPWASDAMLRRVRRRADAWWHDSLQGYADFKRDHAGAEPERGAAGAEGTLGLWRDEAVAAAQASSLTDGCLERLREVGLTAEGWAAAGSEEDRLVRFSFQATRAQRALGAAGLGSAFGAAAALSPNAGAAAALFVCAGTMAATLVCDMRTHTIPLEACAVLLLGGMLFQASTEGVEGVLCGMLAALVIVGATAAVNRAMRIRFPRGAVGRGDMRCMGALAVATGSGAACGFAACYVLAGLVALLGCLTKRLSVSDGVPMAPFLAVWLAVGTAVGLLAG